LNIALIADDSKKTLMENLCIAYRHILAAHVLLATGTTGRVVEEACGLPVQKYLEGRLGGEQQLGVQVAHNEIDMVIYLCDPYIGEPTEDISIARLCDMHNIPLATNLATAEALLRALERGDFSWRELLRI